MSQLSLKDLASQATGRQRLLQQALAALPGLNRRLLVISLGDFAVQALVLAKGTAGPEVVRFAEVTFDTSVRNVRTRLARIMESLGPEPARQVLIVSPEVRFVAAEVPAPPRRRFGRGSLPLTEGARWEIAPFLDFPSERALLGVSLLPRNGAGPLNEPADEPAPEGPPRRPAWVFALDRQYYDSLKRACHEHKKRLIGVLPEEIFAWALAGPDREGSALLIDWRLYEILGTLTRDGKPVRVLREPIRGGEPDNEVLTRVVAELLHEAGEVSEVLIGGPQAEKADLSQLFSGHGGPLVRKWSSEQDLLFAAASGPLPARYLSLLGAAAAWTAAGPKAGGALIDASKPLPMLIREHVHTLPLVLLSLLALGLGGQYLHLKQKTYRLESKTAQLTEQKKTLEEAASAESRLKNRYQDLKERKSELARKNELLAGGLQERHRQLLGLLQDLTTRIPGDIRLSRLSQFSDRVFFIEGTTLHYPAITECVVSLKESPLVEKCQLEKSTRQGEEREASYTFTIRLRLEERHG